MNNFWQKLPKPFFCLAPMADVTDSAFRLIVAKYGKPDVMWTEFVSADGLCSRGREKLLIDLKYSEAERPIVAQIFGSKPENIKNASALCAELGFDGIDINMGCPDKTIEKQNAGAALIKNPKLAGEIIQAAREGAPNLPVSVKTRLGYNKIETDSPAGGWIRELLETKLDALTIHARTRKEMSLVPAHWDEVKKIIKMRDEISPDTLIIGNGGVLDMEDAKRIAKETGCDGIMLGKAIFGNPWLFASLGGERSLKDASRSDLEEPSVEKKLKVMVEHTKLFEKLLSLNRQKPIGRTSQGEVLGKNFAIVKKHYKAYIKGFDACPTERSQPFGRGAKELRIKLMEAKDAGEVEQITNNFFKV